MSKSHVRILFLLATFVPSFSYAADGYIGSSLGLDFYSVIDDGSYTVVDQMVKTEMAKKPKLGEFGAGCPNIDLIADKATSTDILDYGKLSEALKGKSITTEGYQALMTCLNNKYTELVAQKTNEADKLQKISAIGLFTDGNKENSDYDIVNDIDKINGLLFSEDLKYNGVANNSASSLASYLAGNAIPTLFVAAQGNTGNIGISGNALITETGTTIPTATGSTNPTLGNLCEQNNTSIPLDSLMDENFMSDLSNTLASDSPVPNDLRYGGNMSQNSSSGSANKTTPTSAGDFFHPGGSCGGLFCIDTRFISGNMNLLGGGKSTSLEGIIDKHTKILYPISESRLACEVMRNQNAEMSFSSLNFEKTLAGLKEYVVWGKPQKQKRFKSEATPQSEKEELLQIQRCAYAASGLDIANVPQVDGPQVAGYSPNSATNTENITNRIVTTTPQDTNQYGIGANCMELYMDEGRNTYANTFSTDVSEIESFTRAIVQVITNIVNIGTGMDKKPTGCA